MAKSILIYNRTHLAKGYENCPLEEVGEHLRGPVAPRFYANLILFDDGNLVRVIKYRHGPMEINVTPQEAMKILGTGMFFGIEELKGGRAHSIVIPAMVAYTQKAEERIQYYNEREAVQLQTGPLSHWNEDSHLTGEDPGPLSHWNE